MVMGAHAASHARTKLFIPVLTVVVASSLMGTALAATEADLLLKFKDGLKNNSALSDWSASLNPCDWNHSNWFGILCWNGTVWGIKLEHLGLSGTVDVDSLLSLLNFRTLSLMDNKFEGPLPDVKKLGKLKALYLSNNFFSGNIHNDAFQGMGSLKRVFIANNLFTGTIPASLVALPKLMELRLEGNQFSGQIPKFRDQNFRSVNLANNDLEGPIPETLSRMSPDAFTGNKALCGKPLDPCKNSPSIFPPALTTVAGQWPTDKNSKMTKMTAVVIVLAAMVGVMGVCLIVLHRKKKRKMERAPSAEIASHKIPRAWHRDGCTRRGGRGGSQSGSVTGMRKTELSFIREDVQRFDLNDLLRASAEVLGSGTFGSSYKAAVNGGIPIVVKRYRHMNNIGREEFHEHMRRLGRLDHPNLLSLTAYYYRKEEKLLVYHFVHNGSLASHLHGNRTRQSQGLDWQTRFHIMKGIVRGLNYLYTELPMVVPHGHLKSSNVLLGASMDALLTDYALRPVINSPKAHDLMIAYKSPEYAQHGRTSNKTDIWNLGILILEILTGRFPENYLLQSYDSSTNLAAWVNGMVKQKRTSEVFDKDMKGAKDNKAKMISMLKIGLSCCDEDVETRSDINQVVQKMEKLSEETPTSHEVQDSQQHHVTRLTSFNVRRNEDDLSFSVDR